MKKKRRTSRRALLAGLAIVPFAQFSSEAMPAEDATLIVLGHKLDVLTADIDDSIDKGRSVSVRTLEQFSKITAEILTVQAKTIEGLNVKARAACWGLLGDLDPVDSSTLDKSMALSIVRDLIRLQCPHLEKSGALKKLVRDATNGGAVLPPIGV